MTTGLVLLIWDVPLFEFLRKFYFDIFFALRGVSNLAKNYPDIGFNYLSDIDSALPSHRQ